MLMVLIGIMVSQLMLLLVGGDAGIDERFVEPTLLEWLRFGAALWRGGREGKLLECGRLDYRVFAEDGGGSGLLKGRGGAGSGSGVEETWRAPSTDVSYRARSNLTRLVAIAAR
jgi:hypothetical protein